MSASRPKSLVTVLKVSAIGFPNRLFIRSEKSPAVPVNRLTSNVSSFMLTKSSRWQILALSTELKFVPSVLKNPPIGLVMALVAVLTSEMPPPKAAVKAAMVLLTPIGRPARAALRSLVFLSRFPIYRPRKLVALFSPVTIFLVIVLRIFSRASLLFVVRFVSMTRGPSMPRVPLESLST